MTAYRLFPAAAGPASPTAASGGWLSGVIISVTGGVRWLQGYWWWVPAGGDTVPVKCALWQRTSTTAQVLVPGSVVTSGTLTAGQWNFIPLAAPVQLGPGALYVAAIGWTAVHGVPLTANQWGSGQPLAAGIVNGPLTAWSDTGGSNKYPAPTVNYNLNQGLFSASLGADPSVAMPNQGANSDNFWVDVQVSDTPPAGYPGPWQVFPATADAMGNQPDLNKNYIVAMEFSLSQACALNAVRYYSPATAAQLATDAGLWNVAAQQLVAGTHLASPSWSGAAASGWVQAGYASPPVIPPGDYKVAVFNSAASPGVFNATTLSYYTTGFGVNGLTAGPITVPNAAGATSPGQCTYQDTTGNPQFVYPNLYVAGEGQNYWIDVVLTPVASGSGLLIAAGII